ncbi:hypothetical protein HY635_04410 [Candidatus Uhrbacteria bacterium]|nr:hypothetical protein [Candidatus Uhrbacteria bacterium]
MANEERKPLMIRGDRLLLALDVLRYVRGMSGSGVITEAERRRFSTHRVSEIVRRLRDPRFPQYADREIGGNTYGEWMTAVHVFVRLNADAIASTMFDAESILRRDLRDRRWDEMLAVPILHAIASGELTEADFQEVK